MRRGIASITTALSLFASGTAHASDKGWRDASDIGRDALVIGALALPTVEGDWTGTLQAGGSVGAATLLSLGLKETFPEMRPDGSNRKSFPSSHAATSFAAAASLHNRYGWRVGVPAQLVAAFVGLARVKADKHHWYDVVAGAAIGEESGFLITTRRDANVRILPWGDSAGGGVAMTMRF
ncbi:phosphatase PAP2 family protein [Sphingobium olei]|uniref:Phosphatase PAP2 family protein n=1 Tax=Sphingobium olei TaxID=420955 RepID=A0ABW3NXQ2_9SPHN